MEQSSQSSLSDADDNIPMNEDEKYNEDDEEALHDQSIFAPRDFDTTAMTKIRDKLLGIENRCK